MSMLDTATLILVLSLSGSLSPGPMTIASVNLGTRESWRAGFLICVGHSIVEIPLISLIYYGLISTLTPKLEKALFILGGVGLIIVGLILLKEVKFSRVKVERQHIGDGLNVKISKLKIVAYGISVTGLNPSFIAWWPTIGVLMVLKVASTIQGVLGLIFLIVLHEITDYVYYSLISWLSFKGSTFNPKIRMLISILTAIALLVYGVIFLVKGLKI